MSERVVREIADAVGGTIETMERLPDGSGFAVMSMPLPKDHWLTRDAHDEPPMPFRLGTEEDGLNLLPRMRTRHEFASWIREAARYAIRASTANGTIIDFAPDAMVQNFVIGMLGYHTPDGLSHVGDPPRRGLAP